MKKHVISAVLIFTFCTIHIAKAQSFKQYFKPLTLRIDYIHTGNIDNDTYQFIAYAIQGSWCKSKINLIDTFEYGNQKVEVYDMKTNTLIYRYSYNTLMGEYRTTVEGKTISKSF